jgi:hypothetical protein
MKDWYSGIYKGFIISSIILFVIGFLSEGNVSLGAYITGYSVLILGVMMIVAILFNRMKIEEGEPFLQILYTILLTGGPFILMFFVIAFTLYLMIKYKPIIIDNHVSSSYNSFSNINIILIIIQLYIVYTNITTDSFEKTGKISKVTSSMVYLLGILSGISSIILYTILKYFTTDGFTQA